ncbi:hypothetical protein [Corynebacterium xerosis]|uniref:Uncharacterized protein n=1 Tax=Corynebacterium xerosis TaxID=1725 RepID=A0ABV3USA9_9CORY
MDPLRSYASELAAVAEPHGTLFARADTASGTLLVALGGAAVVVVAPGTADPGRVGAVGWRDRGRFVFPHAHGHHRRPGGVGGADGGREVGGAGAFALLVDGGRGHGAGRRGAVVARPRPRRPHAGRSVPGIAGHGGRDVRAPRGRRPEPVARPVAAPLPGRRRGGDRDGRRRGDVRGFYSSSRSFLTR